MTSNSNTGLTVSTNYSYRVRAYNATSFRIERIKESTCTNFALLAKVGANVTIYANSKLTSATTCRYRISASNANGNPSYSNVATATTRRR